MREKPFPKGGMQKTGVPAGELAAEVRGCAVSILSLPRRQSAQRSDPVKLLYQTHSPYARKALVFAHEVGLAAQLEVVHQETSPTVRNAEVFAENPLGKVPVLLRPD